MRSTSIPRAATSVATTISSFPILSRLMVRSLRVWARSPLRGATLNPRASSRSETSEVACLVRTKMSMPSKSSPSMTRARASILSWLLTSKKRWRIFSTVVVLPSIRASLYSPRCSSIISITSLGMVALKSARWAFLGILLRIVSTSSMNPMSSISSASSRTTAWTLSRTIEPRLRWSMSRPGVATMTLAARFKALNCTAMSCPP